MPIFWPPVKWIPMVFVCILCILSLLYFKMKHFYVLNEVKKKKLFLVLFVISPFNTSQVSLFQISIRRHPLSINFWSSPREQHGPNLTKIVFDTPWMFISSFKSVCLPFPTSKMATMASDWLKNWKYFTEPLDGFFVLIGQSWDLLFKKVCRGHFYHDPIYV